MGVDHGLEGRNSEKSQQRRQRKAQRIKSTIQKLIREGDVGGRRNEVKFDEAARQAWLTGFHKRKQERRKYGLTMEILKKQKQKKEMQKLRQKTLADINGEEQILSASSSSGRGGEGEEEDDEAAEGEEHEQATSVFDDDNTVNMFGAVVSVVVDENPVLQSAPESYDRDDGSEEEGDDGGSVRSAVSRHSRLSQNKTQGPSRFERAMQKAKQAMGNKKKKQHVQQSGQRVRGLKKKVESRKLVEKALGRTMKKARRRRD